VVVLVTRPAPDNEATADALRQRGLEPMLAPMLTFKALRFQIEEGREFRGLILTSANALRSLAASPQLARVQGLPVFAVGAHTAQAALDTGFRDVRSAEADASELRELIVTKSPEKRGAAPLLYLAATDISRNLGVELGLHGINVATVAVYRMMRLDDFAEPVRAAFAHEAIEAVLHYSQRSALAFVRAAQRSGMEISALALPQLCLSEPIAATLREAGASRPIVARAPTETDLLDALAQALRSRA
jgi:uroporphyrinogen-III synthase